MIAARSSPTRTDVHRRIRGYESARQRRERQSGRRQRPFDASRAGFILGEGAGSSCSRTTSTPRPAAPRSMRKMLGFGSSNDAFHPIAPRPDGPWRGEGGRSGARPTAVSIPAKLVMSRPMPPRPRWAIRPKRTWSARSSASGRNRSRSPRSRARSVTAWARAGAIETVIGVLSISEQTVPPTLNYATPDPTIDLDIVHAPRGRSSSM